MCRPPIGCPVPSATPAAATVGARAGERVPSLGAARSTSNFVGDAGAVRTAGSARLRPALSRVSARRCSDPERPSAAGVRQAWARRSPVSTSRERSWSTALVWIWHTRLSVTPRISPIWARVRPS